MPDTHHGDSFDTLTTASATKHLTERRALPLEVVALTDLAQQIQQLELAATTTSNTSSTDKTAATRINEQLATLYCQRAQSVLIAVDYDAAMLLPAFVFVAAGLRCSSTTSEPEQPNNDSDATSAMCCGVEQALEDAKAAIARAPTAPLDAFVLAAQCARSLGDTTQALAYIAAARASAPADAPDTQRIEQLAHELVVDALAVRLPSHAPPLLSRLSNITVFALCDQDEQNQPEQEQQQNDEDDDAQHSPERNDERSSSSSSSSDVDLFIDHLRAGLSTLERIASSSWLATLEQLQHENVHHTCAAASDIQSLDAALDATTTVLAMLLTHDRTVAAALGFTDNDSNRTALQALQTLLARRQSHNQQLVLVESRLLRTWLPQTLAPAVKRFLLSPQQQQQQPRLVVTLVHDALVVLTRLLLAAASYRRCLTMPLALPTAALCADVSKAIGISSASDGRFTWMCNDVYARALLELSPDALTAKAAALHIHIHSRDAALAVDDRHYALRCHHFVGFAQQQTGDTAAAAASFHAMHALALSLHDTSSRSLALYALGALHAQHDALPHATTSFAAAQTLCHQTAHARGLWRDASLQHAVAFFAAHERTQRRGAMRVPLTITTATLAMQRLSQPQRRRGSVVCTTASPMSVVEVSDGGDRDEAVAPRKLRRPAIWMGSLMLDVETRVDSKRSLLQTLLGAQTEAPQLLEDMEERSKQSATAKLFGSASDRLLLP